MSINNATEATLRLYRTDNNSIRRLDPPPQMELNSPTLRDKKSTFLGMGYISCERPLPPFFHTTTSDRLIKSPLVNQIPLSAPNRTSSLLSQTIMAEVAAAPNTIEINDALFCQHFKEVVSTYICTPYRVMEIEPWAYYSAKTVTMTGEKRMMASSA